MVVITRKTGTSEHFFLQAPFCHLTPEVIWFLVFCAFLLQTVTFADQATQVVAATTPSLCLHSPETLSADALDRLLADAFSLAMSDPHRFQQTNLFACLQYRPEQIAQIEQITPRPASLTVSAHIFPDSAVTGKFPKIVVDCFNVRYYDLNIARAQFVFPQCQLDPVSLGSGRLWFLKAGKIELVTDVSAENILHVFRFFARAKHLSRLHMYIDNNNVRLSGTVKNGLLRVNFSLTGLPVLEKDTQISFRCRRLQLNNMTMPRNARDMLFRSINPVFDASRTWLNLRLHHLQLCDKMIRTSATIYPFQTNVTDAIEESH